MRLFLSIEVLSLIAGFSAYSDNPEQLGSLRMPKEIEASQLEDKAGAKLPLDLVATNQDGASIALSHYFNDSGKIPVIATMGYYGCPGLCSLVLNALVEGLKNVGFTLGKDYRIISFSIDARETADLAKKKQETYLAAMNSSDQTAWQFHVMSDANAKKLSEVLGFNYIYDKKIDQFAHGAGFFVISPKGILSRTLFGISYNPGDIKLALTEAADGKIGSFVDRVLLSCFHYDPDSHRYGVYILGVMRLGGIATMLVLSMILLMYFRGERKRRQ